MKISSLKKNWYQSLSLSKKLRYIIIGLAVPLAVCIFVIMFLLGWYIRKNAMITYNLNVSSKFSIDFKENIDLKMYHYTVGSKQQQELPIEDVEEAIKIAKTLQKTTVKKESKQAIQNVIDYCDNLEGKMYRIAETKKYESRKQQLEKNIYILTRLIQQRMMDYIYYEAGYIAEIEKEMIGDVIKCMVALIVSFALIVFIILRRALMFTEGITKPIGKLCENVNEVGSGRFEITSAESTDYEIAHLDEGIQQMARQIKQLLENVKAEEKLQHKTQLQLLQAQVNPHFLYNTLDTIIWMIEAGSSSEAVEMLSNLSVFFRTALSKGEDVISLKEEVRHTKSYLHIQQVRYHDILDYEIDLPKTLEMVRLPKLTLQPLVENALYHGIREKRGKGKIKITCTGQGEDVCILVEDDGVGMSKEKLASLQKGLQENKSTGFGLAAVEGRLKLYFGEDYGISITSVENEGVRAKVVVPKNIQLNE